VNIFLYNISAKNSNVQNRKLVFFNFVNFNLCIVKSKFDRYYFFHRYYQFKRLLSIDVESVQFLLKVITTSDFKHKDKHLKIWQNNIDLKILK